MSVREYWWTQLQSTLPSSLTDLRERHILLLTIGLFAGVLLIEQLGVEVSLLRPVIIVPILTFLPGLFVIRILDVERIDLTYTILYSLGVSLMMWMLGGLVLNAFLPLVGVDRVFSVSVLGMAATIGLSGLFMLDRRYVDSSPLPLGLLSQIWNPWSLGLCILPFAAVLGARTVTRFGNNVPILAVLVIIAGIAVAGYAGLIPRRYLPLAIFVVAAALLLHNSVLNHVLAWDAGKEKRLAQLVITNGVWDPNVGGKWMKNAMLRIVLLHPIYALLSDIPLTWEFKTVSPLLFAFAPVAAFKCYQAVVNRRLAFLSAFLPMSMFAFFTVLSVNSRTSGALLFLMLAGLTVTDSAIEYRNQRILFTLFLFGIIISHYAVSYIVLIAIGLIVLGNWVLFGLRSTTQTYVTAIMATLFGLFTLGWYIYIVHEGGAFSRLVGESYTLWTDVGSDLLGESSESVASGDDSKTTQYATREYTSITITLLQYSYLALGSLATISLNLIVLRWLTRRIKNGITTPLMPEVISRSKAEQVLFATALTGVFGITFVGVTQLNTARTLMPALFYFAPFVLVVPVWGARYLGERLDRSMLISVGKTATVAFVILYFALNAGIVGSLNNEYHPNIMIDKGRVVDDGKLAEKNYFWAMHYGTIFDRQSGAWVGEHRSKSLEFNQLNSKQYLSKMYQCQNVRRQPVVQQGSCADSPAMDIGSMNKVYATGGSVVYTYKSEN